MGRGTDCYQRRNGKFEGRVRFRVGSAHIHAMGWPVRRRRLAALFVWGRHAPAGRLGGGRGLIARRVDRGPTQGGRCTRLCHSPRPPSTALTDLTLRAIHLTHQSRRKPEETMDPKLRGGYRGFKDGVSVAAVAALPTVPTPRTTHRHAIRRARTCRRRWRRRSRPPSPPPPPPTTPCHALNVAPGDPGVNPSPAHSHTPLLPPNLDPPFRVCEVLRHRRGGQRMAL